MTDLKSIHNSRRLHTRRTGNKHNIQVLAHYMNGRGRSPKDAHIGPTTAIPTHAVKLTFQQMTNNNDQIVIRGGGLPAWDPSATEKGDSGASSGARTRVRETNKLGPAIFTCTVAFPEHARSDLKGSEDPRDRSA